MVIKAEDAEYLAAIVDDDRGIGMSCEKSASKEEAKESRDNQSLRNENNVESRTELEDQDDSNSRTMHHDKESKGFSVMSSDDTREVTITGERDEGSNHHSGKTDRSLLSNKSTHRKNKGLLHRIRPRSSKANYARSDFSGSVVTTLTDNDSFATEVVRSKSLDQMTDELSVPMTGVDDRNKSLFGRPPLYRRTDDSLRCASIDDLNSITGNEKLSVVDDCNTSVSIMATVSDGEVEIENSAGPKDEERLTNTSLADCVSESSSVLMKRHGLFGQNHRSNTSIISDEEPDTQSLPPLSTTMLVTEPLQQKSKKDNGYKIQKFKEKEHRQQNDNANYRSLPLSDHDVKDVSLMDCATESSSVATTKRDILRRSCRVREVNEGLVAQFVPPSSTRGLSLVDCATDNSSVVTEKRSVIGRNHQPKKKAERSDARSAPLSSQGVSLVDCATDSSSVVTEKGGLFRRYRRSRKVATENDDSCAHSVQPLSTNISSKDELMLQKQYDNEEKSASLADDLTENSSVVARNRMTYKQIHPSLPTKRLESNDPLQRTRQESSTMNKSEQEILVNPAIQLESDNASDVKILLPANQLNHVASEIAFSNQAAVVQDVKRASYCVAKTLDHEHDQKRTPVSPVSEALQYAKSQTGVLKSKFEEKKRKTMTSTCDHKDEDVPPQRLNDIFHSVQSPMTGGVSDLTSPVDLEWEDCDEFGKGKRHYQHNGYRIYDVIQLLRTRFACDNYSDNSVSKEKRCNQHEYSAEQRNEMPVSGDQSKMQYHQDPAKDTVAALRSLRRQLTCGIPEDVPTTDEYFGQKGYQSLSSSSNQIVMPSGGSLYGSEHSTKTGSERHITGNLEASENDETITKLQIRNIRSSPKQTTKNVILTSQASEDSGIVNDERIKTASRRSSFEIPMVRNSASFASSKQGYAMGALNRLRRKKKSNHDEESQMMSSFFSGDTPVINNHAKTPGRRHSAQGLRKSPNKQGGILKETTQSVRAITGEEIEAIEVVEEGGYLRRLIEQSVEEETEVDEQDDDEDEIEERSVWTAAPKLSRGNKTPVFKNGSQKLRDVQLVLSASSTLELPKHKRNTVIRLATVPGNISYQQVTDTFHEENIEFERKQAQNQLKLAKRAVISGQYMDSLDPCFRVFDPALDACDKFCTQNPSEDSDDECSIASVSVYDEKPSGELRQAGKETTLWPFSKRTRIIKAPNRL